MKSALFYFCENKKSETLRSNVGFGCNDIPLGSRAERVILRIEFQMILRAECVLPTVIKHFSYIAETFYRTNFLIMADNIIIGTPTKDLFITMLVRDLTLKDAIGDLVDNCVDGAKKMRPTKHYDGLSIKISANKESFVIEDNCGGIEVEIARNYAFRFGRPKDTPATPGSVGQFGIGMKRSLFKLGSFFKITTVAEFSSFEMEVNVNTWADEQDWNFSFKNVNEGQNNPENKRFTKIEVTQLKNDVIEQFNDNNFIKQLCDEIEREHLYNISNGLVLTINNHALKVKSLEFLDSEFIKTGFYSEVFEDGTSVKIYAGVGEPELKDGGWYIFCNDRLVVGKEQTELTGWTGGRIEGGPTYHNQFKRFRGYVFFEAEDSSKLPWNTTKNGMDRDSPKFKYVRLKMIELMKPVITFLNQLKKEREGDSTDDERPLEKILDATEVRPVSDLKVDDLAKVFVAPLPPTTIKKENDKSKILYYMDVELVDKVKKSLAVKSMKDVGEKTFMYYYEMEVE